LSVEQRAFVFAEMCMKGDLGEKLRDEKSLVPKTSLGVRFQLKRSSRL
jgi:hypothetical protein